MRDLPTQRGHCVSLPYFIAVRAVISPLRGWRTVVTDCHAPSQETTLILSQSHCSPSWSEPLIMYL